MSLLDQSCAYLPPREHSPAHTRARRAGSGDQKQAPDWSGKRVASTAFSAKDEWSTAAIHSKDSKDRKQKRRNIRLSDMTRNSRLALPRILGLMTSISISPAFCFQGSFSFCAILLGSSRLSCTTSVRSLIIVEVSPSVA